MKIAFWVNNFGFSQVDCSKVAYGNPGIGGTEFSAILIAESLMNIGLDTYILCNRDGIFPKGQKFKCVVDIIEACKYVNKNNFSYFVIDSRALTKDLLYAFPHIRFIAWANCFIEDWMNDIFPKCPNLLKFVNVGREQARLCEKMPIFTKSTYIYNAVPTKMLDKVVLKSYQERKPIVVYIGSIHKAKGFHLLAEAWPKVVQSVPNAELYVIGSGNLYSNNTRLGKWNIACEEYENQFMPYLTNNNGILPSVHFMGKMGEEKYALLAKCKVGVPNPSGVSETFGYTAVEMQMMGCAVTTILCPAYIDTVFNKNNLYKSQYQLAENIIKLLLSTENTYDDMLAFINTFSVDKVTSHWVSLFEDLKKIQIKTKKFSMNYIISNFILSLKMLKHRFFVNH